MAYDMYLRTSRLDLDDYNNDTEDGCHITSMAGTWLSVVEGFGGMRIAGDKLQLRPYIPMQWKSYSFRLEFRGRVVKISVTQEKVEAKLESGDAMEVLLYDQSFQLKDKIHSPLE